MKIFKIVLKHDENIPGMSLVGHVEIFSSVLNCDVQLFRKFAYVIFKDQKFAGVGNDWKTDPIVDTIVAWLNDSF